MGVVSPIYQAYHPLDRKTVKTAGAVAAHLAIKFDGTVGGDGTTIFGISDAAANGANEALAVVTDGEAIATSGAAIGSVGLDLATNVAGKLIPAASGKNIVARSLSTAAAADEYILVSLDKEGLKA